jgi:O-antigen ligase
MNYNKLFNHLILAFAFMLPISIAGYNILLGILVLTWLLEAKWKEKWNAIKAMPVFKVMLIYFIFIILSILWTKNLASGLHYLKQYYVFLILPILYTSIDRSKIPQFFSAFLAAMIISEVLSYGIYFDLLTFKLTPNWTPLDPTPFMMHTTYSIFLVFSIFLMITRLVYEQRTRLQTIIYSTFIITMTFNLFINSGRTGQFSLFLAILVFISLHYSFHWMKTIFYTLLFSGSIFIIAFLISPNFKVRIIETYHSFNYTLQNNKAPSHDNTGVRLILWQVASNIILKHPIIGVGIGDERDSVSNVLLYELPQLHDEVSTYSDLHNTYLKVFVATGIIGLTLYLLVFFTLHKQIDQSKELQIVGNVMLALILQYMFIGNFPVVHFTLLFIFIMSLTLKPPIIKNTTQQKFSRL